MEANKTNAKRMIRLKEIDVEKNELKVEEDELKKDLMLEMEEECVDEFTYDDGEEKLLSVRMVESKKVNFDIDKILSKLNEKQIETVTDKVLVVDSKMLSKIIKDNPAIKSIIRPALEIKKQINEEKFQVAIDRGIITEKDVEECYEIKTSKYIKLQRKKK